MPTIDDVFGGDTLKASDIKGRDPTVVIEDVKVEAFKDRDGTAKRKLRITFRGAKKELICNVTNAKRIAHLHGDDFTLWRGKAIQLRSEMVDFGGQVTDGIRVYPPNGHDRIETGRQPLKQEMSDDIPF